MPHTTSTYAFKHKSLCILGRQPELGRAELESILGAENLAPVGQHAMACNLPVDDIPFDRLGGSVRLAKPLAIIDSTNWHDMPRHLTEQLAQLLDTLPEGKLKLGISAFGLRVSARQLMAAGLELKKICKKTGRSVRIVPNTEPELSSAQVLHNQLTGELGIELLLVHSGNTTHLAQTKTVQNIEAYARRDQNRPKRDARVGMLPPKLAQIIINIAAGRLPASETNVVLDPFCGTGVILQESLLMGYSAYGSDLEPRMIDYSRQNIEWLASGKPVSNIALEVGDATSHQWTHPFTAVASETYLGRPLASWPKPDTLHDIVGTCDAIISKFLSNIANQCPSGTRLCLAVPLWRNPNGKNRRLPFLDHLGQMGYNQVSFEHTGTQELVYFRPNQVVARQLFVITRK